MRPSSTRDIFWPYLLSDLVLLAAMGPSLRPVAVSLSQVFVWELLPPGALPPFLGTIAPLVPRLLHGLLSFADCYPLRPYPS